MKPKTNLFVTMGKYVPRQSENLLSQDLAAIFNHSRKFRHELGQLLSSRRIGGMAVDLTNAYARTQKSSGLGDERIIVDAELCKTSESPPAYVVEAKLEQVLSKSQLAKYEQCLKKLARNATLVLLTKYGIDPELSPSLPKGTIWLTWMEVHEICRKLQGSSVKLQGSNVDRFLAKEFAEMLDLNDVPSVDPISAGRWKKLKLFSDYGVATYDCDVNWDTLETVMTAIARLKFFADAAWSTLTEEGYKPSTRAYTWFPEQSDDWDAYCTLSVVYSRAAKGVYSRYLVLAVDCSELVLSVGAGWTLKKGHPEYDEDNPLVEEDFKIWSARASSDLFQQPAHESLEEILPDLQRALKRFKGQSTTRRNRRERGDQREGKSAAVIPVINRCDRPVSYHFVA